MNAQTGTQDEYRRQILECARAMAVARNAEVAGFVVGTDGLQSVNLFTDGNVEKRRQKLVDQLELVAEAFDDFDSLIEEYILAVPLAAYDTGASDVDHFLQWLSDRQTLSDERRDYVACQRSRYKVELKARNNRLAHVRFQELASLSPELSPRWGREPNLWVHLNPIRVWTTLETRALLDDEADLPATVLFFPVGNEIHSVLLEPAGAAMVRALDALGPCRFEQLLQAEPDLEQEDVIEIGCALAEAGAAAFG